MHAPFLRRSGFTRYAQVFEEEVPKRKKRQPSRVPVTSSDAKEEKSDSKGTDARRKLNEKLPHIGCSPEIPWSSCSAIAPLLRSETFFRTLPPLRISQYLQDTEQGQDLVDELPIEQQLDLRVSLDMDDAENLLEELGNCMRMPDAILAYIAQDCQRMRLELAEQQHC